jgi:universal stress protein A
MLPFKKIICPTDFSEPSLIAVRAAVELAEHFGAFLCLLHVVSLTPVMASPMIPATFDVGSYQKALEEDAAAKLRKIVADLVPATLRTCQPRVKSGYPPDEIIGLAEKEETDLIVLATHGLTGWRHILYGSVAERVVQFAPCPVLAIRPPRV